MRYGRRRQRRDLVTASQATGRKLVIEKCDPEEKPEPLIRAGTRLLSDTGRKYIVQPDGSWKRVVEA